MAISVGALTQFDTEDTLHGTVSETYDAGSTAPGRVLQVVAYCQENNSTGAVASVTYGGVAMTPIVGEGQFLGSSSAEAFILVDPPTGSNTLLVTFDNDMNGSIVTAQVITGVDKANPINDTEVSGGATIDTDIELTLTSDAEDCVFFMAATARNTLLANAGNSFTDEVDAVADAGTELVDARVDAGFATVGAHLFHTDPLSAAAHTLTSITPISNRRVGVAWALKPATGVQTGTPTIDNNTRVSGEESTSKSFTHDADTDADFTLIGFMLQSEAGNGVVATISCTVDGVAATSFGQSGATIDRDLPLMVWFRVAPQSGDAVVVTTSDGFMNAVGMYAVDLYDVNPSSPFGVATSTNRSGAGDPSGSLDTDLAGALVLGIIGQQGDDSSPVTPSTGFTEETEQSTGTSLSFDAVWIVESLRQATAGTVNHDPTFTGTDGVGFSYISVNPVGVIPLNSASAVSDLVQETVDFTPDTGVDYVYAIAYYHHGSGAAEPVTFECDYGGQAMDILAQSASDVDRDFPVVVIFGIKTTSTALATVTPGFAGGAPTSYRSTGLFVRALSGVGGTTALNAVDDSATDTNGFIDALTVDLTTTVDNDFAVVGLAGHGGDLAPWTPATDVDEDLDDFTSTNATSGMAVFAGSRPVLTPSTVTMGATATDSDGIHIAGVAFLPATAGAAPPATPEGDATLDIGAVGFAGSGAVASAVVGTGSLSLGSIGFSGSGAVNQAVAGTTTLDLGSVGLAGSGAITAPVLGSGALSVGTVALSGSGLVSAAVLGTGSFDIQAVGLSGSGSVAALVSGTASMDLGSIGFAGTGTTAAVVTGTASFDIGSVALAGAGTVTQNITAELEAEAEFASVMSVNVTTPLTAIAAAEIEATLEPQVVTAVQGTGTLSLDAIGLGGGGQVTPTVFGNGTLPLSIITFVGAGLLGAFVSGSGLLGLDDVGLSGSGSVAPIVQGTASLDIGAIELSGQGAVTSIVAGSGSFPIAAVNISGSGSVLTIPVGQASLDIADIGLVGAGQVLAGTIGQGSFNIGALNISGLGSVVSGLVGQGTLPLAGPDFNGSGSIGALVSGQGSLSVSAVALAGSGQVAAVPQGQASLDIGGITLAGSGLVSQGPSGVGSLEVGAVSISGSGSILAPVAGSGQFTVAEVAFLGQGSTTGVIDGSFIFDIGAIEFNGAGITGDRDAETTELPPRDVEYVLYDVDLEGQSGQNLEEEFRLMGSKVAIYDVQRYQGESVDYSLELARDFTTGVYTLVASRKRDPDVGDPTLFNLNGVVDSQNPRRILFTPDAAAIALEKGVYYLFAWEELNGDVRLASAASLIIKNAAQI